jgi:hypothetical protein
VVWRAEPEHGASSHPFSSTAQLDRSAPISSPAGHHQLVGESHSVELDALQQDAVQSVSIELVSIELVSIELVCVELVCVDVSWLSGELLSGALLKVSPARPAPGTGPVAAFARGCGQP